MTENELEKLKLKLREFAEARDWDQFHSPKNLSMALIAEAAELVEHFQWLTQNQSKELPPEKLAEVEEDSRISTFISFGLPISLGLT